MTRDTGELLAQVIPVLALALGIELRSFATKAKSDRQEEVQVVDRAARWVGVFVAVVLAAGEQVAIAAANGVADFTARHLWTSPLVPGSPQLSNALNLCIVAVFLLPAHQAITAGMSSSLSNAQRYSRSLVWAIALMSISWVLPLAL